MFIKQHQGCLILNVPENYGSHTNNSLLWLFFTCNHLPKMHLNDIIKITICLNNPQNFDFDTNITFIIIIIILTFHHPT
jgi:hypothetical protein